MRRDLPGFWLGLAGLLFVPLAAARPDPPRPRVAQAFVALCDNAHQGIVPVPAALGNGDDPDRNLYWGADYGVRSFFKRSPGWQLVSVIPGKGPVLERAVFRHRSGLYLVADAYRGRDIAGAIGDFLRAGAGQAAEVLEVPGPAGPVRLELGAGAELVAYVGHDGLMDGWNPEIAALEKALPERRPGVRARPALVIACASRAFFAGPLERAGLEPWLLTTGLLAAEAYPLEAALSAYASGEGASRVRERAAAAYARHQRCGLKAARRLFVGGNVGAPR